MTAGMNETRAASGDAHLAETAGLVLAGGRSSRMGADKALLRFPGGTLLERTMERIGSLAGPLVLSLAPGQRLPEGLRLPPGLLMATDGEPWQGPLWGLAEGFRALAGRARRVLVVPVDMPNLTLPWMNRLLQGLDDDGETLACMYRHRGYLNGLTAAYDLRIQGRLEELIGGGRHRLSLLGEGVPRRVLDTEGEDAP
ncbi:MAG: molybdenum cofactor guanylyltransferase, partial [Deltaproteobacteria bacterium]|nr:molybdenum cofactor guanylyltransferase [Deltaproteobacteria bacterium]